MTDAIAAVAIVVFTLPIAYYLVVGTIVYVVEEVKRRWKKRTSRTINGKSP